MILVSSPGFCHGIWFGGDRTSGLLSYLPTYLTISLYIHTKVHVFTVIYTLRHVHARKRT